MSRIEEQDKYYATEDKNGRVFILEVSETGKNAGNYTNRKEAKHRLEESEKFITKTADILESVAKIALGTTVFIAGKELISKSPKKSLVPGILGTSAYVGLSLIGKELHKVAGNQGLKADAVDDIPKQTTNKSR